MIPREQAQGRRQRGRGAGAAAPPRRGTALALAGAWFLSSFAAGVGSALLVRHFVPGDAGPGPGSAPAGGRPGAAARPGAPGKGKSPGPESLSPEVREAFAARFRQGMQSFEAERYSDALEDFAGASAIAPSLPDSYHFIGEIYRKFVLTDKAEQAYRRALAADPAFPPTRRSLAMLLHEAGKYEEAMAILKELEAEFPGDSFVIGELAINKLALGKAQEAVALLEKFNALAGKQPWGLAHLGRALARAGETARAEAAYREALALDANFVVAHYWLGQLLATTGRKEESARVLATYSRLRELENEEHQLRMTLLRDANDVRVLVNLARVRFLLGKRRDSLNILERARRLAPGDPELEKIYNQVKSAVDSAGSH